MSKSIRLFLTGFGMGTADIIPGVSGGTMAFIFGIYEELLDSIKKATGEAPKMLFKGKVKDAYKTVPWAFLLPVSGGIFSAILLLSNLLSFLLDTQATFVRSFFFGLVLASGYIVSRRVKVWTISNVISMIVLFVGAFELVGLIPVSTPEIYLAFFLSGALAICAMILPGISGAFILVLLGKYDQVLNAVVHLDIVILLLVMGGAVLGLAMFSRVLSWLFAKHHDLTVAGLTSLMLGSIRKLWPWKEVLQTGIDRHGEIVILQDSNILPKTIDVSVIAVLLLVTLGIVLLIKLSSFNRDK